MTERTSREVITQAINDFDSIREAIRGHRIKVPYPTRTSEYAELIAKIKVGSITGSSCDIIDGINNGSIIGSPLCFMTSPNVTVIIGKSEFF